jgi:hypothetical protein
MSALAAVRPIIVRPGIAARRDHWFKNAFMLFGRRAGDLLNERRGLRLEQASGRWLPRSAWPLNTCLTASSNDVRNELLRRPRPTRAIRDEAFPTRAVGDKSSPRESRTAEVAWALGATGKIGLSFTINTDFGCTAVALWLLGVSIYTVPPVRTKSVPVPGRDRSESANNAVPPACSAGSALHDHGSSQPLSLLLSYWMVGRLLHGDRNGTADIRAIREIRRSRRCTGNGVPATTPRSNLPLSILFLRRDVALFARNLHRPVSHLELIRFVPFRSGDGSRHR